jgi:beta propeller repeat protein
MGNKILFVTLVLMCLISTISTTSAGKETQMTQNQRLVCDTEIYDNIITWYETSANGVNVYDISKGKMLNIPHNGAENGEIPIYANKIVWHDMDDNITFYDISSNEEIQIATNSYSPDIYKNNIVYVKSYRDLKDPYTMYFSVYLYNLTTKKETQITENSKADYVPAIWGNKLVWSRAEWSTTDQNYSTNIYVYDIPTRQISSVSTSGKASDPDIYGDIIVWSETDNGKTNIYMLDISTHETKQITTSGIAGYPAVYGNRIVYESAYYMSSVYVSDIYMYDISTGQTTQITKCGCAWSPSIYKNKIVYVDSHSIGTYNFEGGAIYLYNLSVEDYLLTADFTANVTYGVAPLKVQFTSNTPGNPTDYYWIFEPSNNSDWNSHHAVNAVHTFKNPGNYTVSLIVTNGVRSDAVTKNNYVTVK